MSDLDPCDREVPDPGQAREPVMTETTRKLARRVTQYRRESLGWLKQAIRADSEAGEANNALIRERQIAVLTKGDGHVDCAIEAAGDTGQARETARRGCQAQIAPSWANSWVTCGYAVRNGKCVKYGHEQDPDTTPGDRP